MKKTFKKILATLLAIVLLFGAAPLCRTDGILTTKASALETVSGSYDYLVSYINQYGSRTGSSNSMCIETKFTYSSGAEGSISVEYHSASDSLIFVYVFDMDSMGLYVISAFEVKKNASKYDCIVGVNMQNTGYITIDPQRYTTAAQSVTFTNMDLTSYSQSNINEAKSFMCTILDKQIIETDQYLLNTTGIGLGNFGFTNISNPSSVPGGAGAGTGFFASVINFFKGIFILIISFFAVIFA